ncbi:MAG: hypothetical protein QXW00_02555 [Candidatus Woesearchaeota archaeon]
MVFNLFKKKEDKEKAKINKKIEEEYKQMLEEDYKKYEGKEIIFIPKKCPKCGALMSVRELGVWGYWCDDCEFWWGTYDPYPIVRDAKKAKKAKNE